MAKFTAYQKRISDYRCRDATHCPSRNPLYPDWYDYDSTNPSHPVEGDRMERLIWRSILDSNAHLYGGQSNA